MKVTKHTKRKTSYTHLWLFLLLFSTAFFPLGVKGQNLVTGFECSFENLDGGVVYPCGSVVTAHITFPVAGNPVQTVRLIFPNSFEIIGVSAGVTPVFANGPQQLMNGGWYNGTT